MSEGGVDSIHAEELDRAVQRVLEAVPSADPDLVREEFERYEKDFLMPPKNAVRSVVTRMRKSVGVVDSESTYEPPETQVIETLDEVEPGTSNLTIEVRILEHRRVERTVRGERRTIGAARIEDRPNAPSSERNRYDCTDWGDNEDSLRPGAVARIEGARVSEWEGRRRLEINRSSRVVVLEASTAPVVRSGDVMNISKASRVEGSVTLVARVMSKANRTITRRDGSQIEVVSGRLGDSTGAVSFTAWEGFDWDVGGLIRIADALMRRYRDTPDLSFGRYTTIEEFHDAEFPTLDELERDSATEIRSLTEGARGVSITAEIIEISSRKITVQGEEKTIWGGEIIDPTGRCRFTVWSDPEIDSSNTPMPVRLQDVRIRAWQGLPDVTIDNATQIIQLEEVPWEAIDPMNHWVTSSIEELTDSSSRSSVRSTAKIVSIRDDCGPIERCPDCRRVLRDGECADHGRVEGIPDLRLRFVLDDGRAALTTLLGKDATESLLSKTQDVIEKEVREEGQERFVNELRKQWLGAQIEVTGRTRMDDFGGFLLVDSAKSVGLRGAESVAEIRERWGL